MTKYNLKNKYKLQLARERLNSLAEKNAVIELKEVMLKRSLDQNSLYWLWLTCIEKETETDKHELHYLYRANFLPKDDERICNILRPELWERIKKLIQAYKYFPGMNEIINIISFSTTEIETDQFTNYLDEIRKHVRVNYNVILLTLDDSNFQDFYREYGFK